VAAGSVVVFGDVMVDVRATMTRYSYQGAVAREAAVDGRLGLAVAGTGVNMARALTDQFDTVGLVGAYGYDATGDLIGRCLETERFTTWPLRPTGATTGLVIVLRDGARADAPHGDRIVVADRGANDAVAVTDLDALEGLISDADLVCADGYGLLHEPRRTATLHAMRLARAAGHDVFCDLVPHDLDQHFRPEQLEHWLADATIVGTSGTTLARLLGLPVDPTEPLDHDTALLVAAQAGDRLGITTMFVRFGYGHCSWSLAYDREERLLWCEPTDYPSLPPDQLATFGDTLTAHELRRLHDYRRDELRTGRP
jgi:sugar/nucleoside kinase (ribokinase family)